VNYDYCWRCIVSRILSSANRRNSCRRGPKKNSKVLCVTGACGLGPNVAVTLLDVSETGIRLVLQTPLPPGHEVEVSLDAPAHRRPIHMKGEVVWCVALADGNFCLGIRFATLLKWTELQALTHF